MGAGPAFGKLHRLATSGPPVRRLRARIFAHALLGAVLLWGIIEINLPLALAPVAPETALLLSPDHPDALVALADKRLDAGEEAQRIHDRNGSVGDRETRSAAPETAEMESEITRALLRAPLDARALRALGELESGDKATLLMEGAARRSLHETTALFWLLQRRHAEKDFAGAARLADALLLVRPQFLSIVMPYLAEMADNPAAIGSIDGLMAEHPRWRDIFLNDLTYFVRDARTPLRVFLPLQNTPFPPTNEALGRYLTFLLQHKLYAFAYDAWRRFAPADRLRQRRLLFNGNFESPPSRLPFDWMIVRGSGVTIDIVVDPFDAARRALSLEYSGILADPHSVSQFVRLAPGSYRMKGRHRGEVAGRHGLRWRMTCVEGSNSLGESEMALRVGHEWRPFHFDFTVPDKDCALQKLALELSARSPSERIVSGRLFYTDLAIEPIETGDDRSTLHPRSGSDARATRSTSR